MVLVHDDMLVLRHIAWRDLAHLLDAHLLAHSVEAHSRLDAGVLAGAAAVIGWVWWGLRHRSPDPEERERQRREWLTRTGRLTDGSLLDARSLDGEQDPAAVPEMLVYRYRIAGVRYECAQDVSRLMSHRGERRGSHRLDEPVQVRYDARNPGNSIVLSETWTGLRWLRGTRPSLPPG